MARRQRGRTNGWDVLRDVLLACTNKGQLPLIMGGVLLAIPLLRMPAQDASRFMFEFLSDIREARIVGYVLFVLTLVGWYLHARLQRRTIHDEIQRISRERSRLQQRELPGEIESSD